MNPIIERLKKINAECPQAFVDNYSDTVWLKDIIALIETLEKRAEAGKRLAGVVGFAARMPDHGDCRMNINLVLAAYDQLVKE